MEDDDDEQPPCLRAWWKLDVEQQDAAITLGYDEESWWNNDEREIAWHTLMAMPRERDAAIALGFTEELWLCDASLSQTSREVEESPAELGEVAGKCTPGGGGAGEAQRVPLGQMRA